MRLFSYDNIIIQTLNKILDCLFLSVLWIIFSIPLITFGASTTALYYTANKVLRNDRSHVWREFWSSFKSNFKQSTIVWLILMVLYYVLITDCFLLYSFYKQGALPLALLIVFVVMLAFAVIWGSYLFPYIARFANTTKQILKNCLLFSIRHILMSIVLLAFFVLAIVVFVVVPVAIFVLPAAYMLLANLVLESIFRRYMSPEDLEAEEDRNRDYYN